MPCDLKGSTYIIVLIVFIHAAITLVFCYNFASVLDNDLLGIKAAITSHTIPAISGLDYFNANSIFTPCFPAFLEISKSAISAAVAASSAIRIVTFVEHSSVLTIHITSSLWGANAFRGETVKQR